MVGSRLSRGPDPFRRRYTVIVACRKNFAPELLRFCAGTGLDVVGQARDLERLRRLLPTTNADALLLDTGLDRLHHVMGILRTGTTPLRTAPVLVTEAVDTELIELTQKTGAAGVLLWPFSRTQFVLTLSAAFGAYGEQRASLHHELHGATDALRRIAEQLAEVRHLVPIPTLGPRLRVLPELDRLSPREHEVLMGLVGHKRVAQVARDLHISPHTVRNHLKSIFSKLSVRSQRDLLEKVIERPASARGRS